LFVLCFSAQVLGCYGSLFNLTQGLKLIKAKLAAASTFFAVTLFYICSAAQFVTQEVTNNNNNNNNKCCEKEAEKKLKYKSLCIEIKRLWNLKCTIIPVIIGATGIVTRSLRKNLEAMLGKHSRDSLQKTAILGTSHIYGKYCSVKLEA
jgi:hypothetical protein